MHNPRREIHGGAVIRAFLKLNDERHGVSTRRAGGSLITLDPGGIPSKLAKHGRFETFAPRRPGFAGQLVVVIRLLRQVGSPDIAEHEQRLLGTFWAGQRIKASHREEQGTVPSRGRLPVVAHARVVLTGEQRKDSALAFR